MCDSVTTAEDAIRWVDNEQLKLKSYIHLHTANTSAYSYEDYKQEAYLIALHLVDKSGPFLKDIFVKVFWAYFQRIFRSMNRFFSIDTLAYNGAEESDTPVKTRVYLETVDSEYLHDVLVSGDFSISESAEDTMIRLEEGCSIEDETIVKALIPFLRSSSADLVKALDPLQDGGMPSVVELANSLGCSTRNINSLASNTIKFLNNLCEANAKKVGRFFSSFFDMFKTLGAHGIVGIPKREVSKKSIDSPVVSDLIAEQTIPGGSHYVQNAVPYCSQTVGQFIPLVLPVSAADNYHGNAENCSDRCPRRRGGRNPGNHHLSAIQKRSSNAGDRIFDPVWQFQVRNRVYDDPGWCRDYRPPEVLRRCAV